MPKARAGAEGRTARGPLASQPGDGTTTATGDWYAFLPGAGLWLLSGHAPARWLAQAGAVEFELERGLLTGEGTVVWIPAGEGGRFLVALPGPRPPVGVPLRLRLPASGAVAAFGGAAELDPEAAVQRARRALAGADEGAPDVRRLRALLPLPVFMGEETLSRLGLPVAAGVDRVLQPAPGHVGLVGWLADPGSHITTMAVGAGGRSFPLDRTAWVPVARPEILAAVSKVIGADRAELGFIAYVETAGTDDPPDHLRFETRCGQVAFLPLPPSTQVYSLAGLRDLLAPVRPEGPDMPVWMRRTLVPLVTRLNAARLARRPAPRLATHGTPPAEPVCSLVVPVHGRLDLVEVQLATLSERPDPEVELIYVLDDPALAGDLDRLAASAHLRFGLPLQVLHLGANLGFAPACNAGVRVSRAPVICLLNSDVFPQPGQGMDWIRQLMTALEEPGVGAVGPLLLFEDRTVQHAGMEMRELQALPLGPFPVHPGKGGARERLEEVTTAPEALTGACLMLRRETLEGCGMLDERYVLGDFEDAALCHSVRSAGLAMRLRDDVELYHLERQTQGADDRARTTITFINASIR